MQSTTIKPRATFRHVVTVECVPQEIAWTFSTRKKNISFGLFKKKLDVLKPVSSVSRSTSAQNPLSSSANSSTSSIGSLPVNGSSASLGGSATNDGVLQRHDSKKDGAIGKKKNSKVELEPDLVELIPVTHYESSKYTIKGSFYAEEIGIYVLMFDNTFSVNTSKKLSFQVSLRDAQLQTPSVKKEVEGWILKKGNRNFQGYAKRWLKVDGEGNLSYRKHAGSYQRGSAFLPDAVVRADHDRLLINIDTGETLMHFKALSTEDFQMWIAVIEMFADAKHGDLGGEQSFSPHDAGTEYLEDEHVLQKQINSTLIELRKEISKLDKFAGRVSEICSNVQIDELVELKNNLELTSDTMTRHAEKLQSQLDSYSRYDLASRTKNSGVIFSLERTLQACLLDNNEIRTKYGLDPVSLHNFQYGAVIDAGSMTRRRPGSIISQSDIFYDAEEGEGDGVSEDDDLDEEDESSSRSSSISIVEESEKSERYRHASKTTTIMSGSDFTSLSEPTVTSEKQIVRRKNLPAGTVSMANVSLMSILRNNMGKDLSTVSMPIALNEPLNLLQRLAEELEYSTLLDEANQTDDAVQRMVLVAAFAISGYSSTIHRAGRKPFNPLLGETYECIRDDRGFRFIAEKVSHQPPVMACHAESSNFVFYQDNQVKSKFWGKSMELVPIGSVHVILAATQEHYVWTKVTTCMRNIFSGTRYLEHYGAMKLENLSTGIYCEVTFKESGYFSNAKNEVTGAIYNGDGAKIMSLTGRWDESICKFQDSSPNNLEIVWRKKPHPPNHADMYGFTQFAVELNEITPDIAGLLPSTDTRLRPDQRMYEEGRAEEAELEKQRLEQKQRENRKIREMEGVEWVPRFFARKQPDELIEVNNNTWQYIKNSYWENRGYIPQLDIFGCDETESEKN